MQKKRRLSREKLKILTIKRKNHQSTKKSLRTFLTILNVSFKVPYHPYHLFVKPAPTNDTAEDAKARAQRKKDGSFWLNDFNFISTLGTGTFGRVRLVKHRDDPAEALPLALKCLKKSEIIKLKQIEHVKSEKNILERINHPFIVNLKGTF